MKVYEKPVQFYINKIKFLLKSYVFKLFWAHKPFYL